MAEIFVVNKSSALAGQFVSDLPVVNATPVARQIGFYISAVMDGATASAYLAGATITDGLANAGVSLADVTIATAGPVVSTVTGNNVDCVGLTCLEFVASYIDDMLASGSAFSDFEAGINTDLETLSDADGALTVADIFASATLEGLMRAMTGASYESDYSYAETGVVGNHRLIGGKRRIYLRDRVEASLGEGFLRVYSDSDDLTVFLADGSIL